MEIKTYENEVYFRKLHEEISLEDLPVVEAGRKTALTKTEEPVITEELSSDEMDDWNTRKDDFKKKTETKGEINVKRKRDPEKKDRSGVWVHKLENGDF